MNGNEKKSKEIVESFVINHFFNCITKETKKSPVKRPMIMLKKFIWCVNPDTKT